MHKDIERMNIGEFTVKVTSVSGRGREKDGWKENRTAALYTLVNYTID